MFLTDQAYFSKIVVNAPGPMPWYVNKSITTDSLSMRKKFIWRQVQDNPYLSDKILLCSEKRPEVVYLMFSYYCYILFFDNKIITWNTQRIQNYLPVNIVIRILDVDSLEPIDDIVLAAKTIKDSHDWIFSKCNLVSEILIPAPLSGKIRHLDFPVPFKNIDELLVIADTSNSSVDPIKIGIFSIKPKVSTISVSLQEWFNQGNYDFGYQWITRVIRDPVSKNIFGEGMRLEQFVLDPTGSKVLEFLTKKP